MNTSTRERRDWTLLIFLIPIGIIFMLIAGQFAVRLVPVWRVNAGMQSKLDPNNLSVQQNAPVQPISPAILTPLGWLDTFLTPGSGGSGNQNIVFPPFVVFEPTATPAITASPTPTVATTQPSPTIPVTQTPTVVGTPSATRTPKPTDPPTSTPPPVVTTPPPVVTTPPPVTSTLVAQTQVPSSPLPLNLNIGPPSGSPVYNLHDNNYIVIDLGPTSTNQIQVNGVSETNYYDMVYYEMPGCVAGGICLDRVIIGISDQSDGSSYYMVFNWGDGIIDTNSNVAGVLPLGEADNQTVTITAPAVLNGTTGIAIDVDTALSAPPVGWYQFIVIQVPITTDADGADIDSVQIVEIQISPTPAPPPAPISPMAAMSISSVDKDTIPLTGDAPSLLADVALSTPADAVPSAPADAAPSSPADAAPSSPADAAPSLLADVAPSTPADAAPSAPADAAPSALAVP